MAAIVHMLMHCVYLRTTIQDQQQQQQQPKHTRMPQNICFVCLFNALISIVLPCLHFISCPSTNLAVPMWFQYIFLVFFLLCFTQIECKITFYTRHGQIWQNALMLCTEFIWTTPIALSHVVIVARHSIRINASIYLTKKWAATTWTKYYTNSFGGEFDKF